MFGYIDLSYFILLLPALILGLVAQAMVSSAYSRYSRERNARGVTGADAAQQLLLYNDLGQVKNVQHKVNSLHFVRILHVVLMSILSV